jgi:hypothetical protein
MIRFLNKAMMQIHFILLQKGKLKLLLEIKILLFYRKGNHLGKIHLKNAKLEAELRWLD